MAEIGINLRADPAQFEAGTKAAQKAMAEWERSATQSADDVADKLVAVIRTLVRLGTESGKTRSDMVDDLRRFGLSAEQAEEAIEAVWDEMGEGQKAARDVEEASDALRDVEKNADSAADATRKIGDETSTTGGRFDELGDIARDVLEGDFGSAAETAIGALGALGLFAGAGGALASMIAEGAGSIIGDWIQQWTTGTEEQRKLIASMYEDMLASGRAALSDQFVTDRIAEIYNPDNVDEFNRAVTIANQLGIDRSTIIQGMAGSEEAHAEIIARSRDKLEALNQQQADYVEQNGKESAAIADKIGEVERGIDAYDRIAGAQETAAGRAREAADAINSAGGAADTTAGKIDGVSLALNSMPSGKTVVIDADTSRFFAEMEAIRRKKYSASVGIDVVINERRGRQTVD